MAQAPDFAKVARLITAPLKHLPPASKSVQEAASYFDPHPDPEPHETLSSKQFKGFTGGPEEAGLKAGLSDEEWDEAVKPYHSGYGQTREHDRWSHPQGHLFDPEKVPLLEAHQQTPSQFAADPRTWWHGRYTRGGRLSTLSGTGNYPGTETSGEGFHAGTKEAAEERMEQRRPQDVWEDHRGHLYPLRITGPVEGPENVHIDTGFHGKLGYGGIRQHGPGYLYENESEDRGSISVGTPQRKGYLSTHREMVAAAQQRGEHVHPLIEWASRMHPEHEGAEFEHERVRRYREWHGDKPHDTGQMSMFDPDEVQMSLAGTLRRQTYTTQSGGIGSVSHTIGGRQFTDLEHG